MNIPRHLLSVAALTDQREEPTYAVQFAVLDLDGSRHAYGDQSWVAYGEVLRTDHTGGRIQCRTVTISYGEWGDV